MPTIKQYDWSKLKPELPEKRQTHGTLNFSTHEYRESRKNSRHGAIKTTRQPKVKLKDKRLFNDSYDQQQHLRSIMGEN